MTKACSVVATLALGGTLALGLTACEKETPKPAAPPAAEPVKPPPPPAEAAAPAGDAGVKAKTKMVANPDGLSLADRIAKRQADEKKLAAELATAEKDRLLKYDKTKLPLHQQVYAFIKKTKGQYDALEAKTATATDKEKAKADVEKLAGSLRAPIEAMGKKMATIDPKGGNSNVTTDYDVMLNALANDYPAAMVASIDGAKQALGEQKADFAKRSKKIEDWLAELKAAKK
jgi:hypothetical protein